MSHDPHQPVDHDQDELDDAHLSEEDIVEVHDDSGDEPMDDDDDHAGYAGEIIIGCPGPGEEDMEAEQENGRVQDNSWGVSGELICDHALAASIAPRPLSFSSANAVSFSAPRPPTIHFHPFPSPDLPESTTSNIRRRRRCRLYFLSYPIILYIRPLSDDKAIRSYGFGRGYWMELRWGHGCDWWDGWTGASLATGQESTEFARRRREAGKCNRGMERLGVLDELGDGK